MAVKLQVGGVWRKVHMVGLTLNPAACHWDCTFVIPDQFIQGATTGN